VVAEPGACSAASSFVALAVPVVFDVGTTGQGVLEAAESALAVEGDAQPGRGAGVGHGGGEAFHVAIGRPGPLGLDPQPSVAIRVGVRLIGALVGLLIEFVGVLQQERRIDPPGRQIDPARTVPRTGLQNIG
jgi:hypothetical protein